MPSGRILLLDAAVALFAADPQREPTTRELYEAAGVAAPTLYHHFGTKDGLFDVVVQRAFDEYLRGKQGMLRTGDLVVDFANGWDLHVEFGVQSPALYALMYSPSRVTDAAATAAAHLRSALERMRVGGLLRLEVDIAASVTMAAAVGCVTELNRHRLPADDPVAMTIRAGLIEQLTGQPLDPSRPDLAARTLIRSLSSQPRFSSAERALLTQWLRTIATERPNDHDQP